MAYSLSYSENLETDEQAYKLFELSPELEEELNLKGKEKSGKGSVLLKGSTDLRPLKRRRVSARDGVVLCTEGKTFNVKCAETSNLVMLIPSLFDPVKETSTPSKAVAVGTSKMTFVLRQQVPGIDQLETVLDDHTYRPRNDASSSDAPILGVTIAEIESLVQASKNEIMEGLKTLGVAKVPFSDDGKERWCKIDKMHELKCFDSILSVVETNNWDAKSSIPVNEVSSSLSDQFEPWVAEHVLRFYSTGDTYGATPTVGLHEQQAQAFRAVQILERLEPSELATVSDIAREWACSLPSQLQPPPSDPIDSDSNDVISFDQPFVDLVRKEALALVKNGANGHTCQRFFAHDLSLLPEERFKELFAKSQKWMKDDLVNYLKGVPGDLPSLLLKHTRATSVGTQGVTFYTRR